MAKRQRRIFFTSSQPIAHLPLFFFMSWPSLSSPPSPFMLLSTPKCLFQGFSAWASYRSFPGLQLDCEEATVNSTFCYQPRDSHNEADMHIKARTLTLIHTELDAHRHTHHLLTLNKILVQTGVIFLHGSSRKGHLA